MTADCHLANLLSFHNDLAVGFDGDGHAVLDVVEELLAQAVHNGHGHIFQPHISQNGTGSSQRIDVGSAFCCGK